MELLDLVSKISSFNAEQVFLDIMYEKGSEAVRLQIEQHILLSVRSTGSPIGEYTNSKYLARKLSQGSVTAPRVDLHKTGVVHEKTKVTKQSYGLEIFTDATETDKWLTKRYGDDLWGLTDASTTAFRDIVLTEFINRFNALIS